MGAYFDRLNASIKNGGDENSLVNSLSQIPEYAMDAATGLPEKMWGILKQAPYSAHNLLSHPLDSERDFLGGVARGAQRTGAGLLEGGEWLTRKGAEQLGNALHHPVNVPYWNAREAAGLGDRNPVDLGSMIETENPDPLLSGLGQYGIGAASLGSSIPRLIAGNAITNALQAEPNERIKAATEGVVNAGLPLAAGKVAGMGFNAVRPSNLLRGTLSPQELQANLEAAEGTNTGLGNVIGSPTLKRVQENILPQLPLSGAYTTMQKTANQLTQKGEGLMEKIGENLPAGDKTQILQDALKKAAKQASQEKDINYRKVNEIADESGLVVGREKFQSKAKEILHDISQSPELEREFPKDLKSDLQAYAEGTKGNSLKLSNIFKGKLNDKVNDLYIGGKKHESGLVKELKDALGEDIEDAIKTSKNPNLKQAYETAQKEYGSKYAPFENPDVTKFTREGGDPDLMLSHFLRTGVNDRGELIGRLTTKLPKNLQNLPLHMYLSRATEEGQLNPVKLSTLYGKLGEKQRSALIPDKNLRKEIENYTRSIGMNKESFQTMANPKTGQRNLDAAIAVMEVLAGHDLAGMKGMLAALPLGAVAGRAANKLLTSEVIRKSLVKKMINKK